MTKLELDLPENTLKKLRAYAMLSGEPVSALTSRLVELVDQTITDRLVGALAEMDGRSPAEFYNRTRPHDEAPAADTDVTADDSLASSYVSGEPPDNAKSAALKKARAEEKAEIPVTHDEVTGSELSDDDLPEEVKGIDEEPLDDEAFMPAIAPKVANAGENSEAYLDAIFAQEKKQVHGRKRTEHGFQSTAREAFNSKSPRVRIQEFTGDED